MFYFLLYYFFYTLIYYSNLDNYSPNRNSKYYRSTMDTFLISQLSFWWAKYTVRRRAVLIYLVGYKNGTFEGMNEWVGGLVHPCNIGLTLLLLIFLLQIKPSKVVDKIIEVAVEILVPPRESNEKGYHNWYDCNFSFHWLFFLRIPPASTVSISHTFKKKLIRLMSRFHSIDRAAEKFDKEGKLRNDLARWVSAKTTLPYLEFLFFLYFFHSSTTLLLLLCSKSGPRKS